MTNFTEAASHEGGITPEGQLKGINPEQLNTASQEQLSAKQIEIGAPRESARLITDDTDDKIVEHLWFVSVSERLDENKGYRSRVLKWGIGLSLVALGLFAAYWLLPAGALAYYVGHFAFLMTGAALPLLWIAGRLLKKIIGLGRAKEQSADEIRNM